MKRLDRQVGWGRAWVGAVVCAAGVGALGCSSQTHGPAPFSSGASAGSGASTGGSGSPVGGSGRFDASVGTSGGAAMPDGGSGLALNPCAGNLACNQVVCDGGTADGGGVTTTVKGTVYDPAGKVPLYNVVVYVPNGPLDPIASTGATCDRCGASVSGNPLVITSTDAKGQFTLRNVPAGSGVPLVMQIGKWRREVMLPPVQACADNVLTDPSLTRLPRSASDGLMVSMPRIALATGGIDPLECLLRKIGISDSEFSTAGGAGHVHLYAGGGYETLDDGGTVFHAAASRFASTLNGGAPFADATPFWTSADRLKGYDILLLSCEGTLNPASKSPADAGLPDPKVALYDFLNAGGRVFASHWHRYWFSDGPSPVPSVATWKDRYDPAPGMIGYGTINTSFPKGVALRDWLVNVGASTTPGILPIKDSKHNVDAVDPTEAQDWISMPNPNACYPGSCTMPAVEYLTFNTPVGQPADTQCGRVVYSDLHVSSGDNPGQPFPSGCVTSDLSPQEKALEFMLFDLSSCIVSDTQMPPPPH